MADIVKELKILCSIKEVDKNHLWLRPRLDRDGYDLFYWGTNGWTNLDICHHKYIHDKIDILTHGKKSFNELNMCSSISIETDNVIEAINEKIAELERRLVGIGNGNNCDCEEKIKDIKDEISTIKTKLDALKNGFDLFENNYEKEIERLELSIEQINKEILYPSNIVNKSLDFTEGFDTDIVFINDYIDQDKVNIIDAYGYRKTMCYINENRLGIISPNPQRSMFIYNNHIEHINHSQKEFIEIGKFNSYYRHYDENNIWLVCDKNKDIILRFPRSQWDLDRDFEDGHGIGVFKKQNVFASCFLENKNGLITDVLNNFDFLIDKITNYGFQKFDQCAFTPDSISDTNDEYFNRLLIIPFDKTKEGEFMIYDNICAFCDKDFYIGQNRDTVLGFSKKNFKYNAIKFDYYKNSDAHFHGSEFSIYTTK